LNECVSAQSGRQLIGQAANLRFESAAAVGIHPLPFVLLLGHKVGITIADTHFTIPRRVEGWVDLATAVMCSQCPELRVAVVKNTELVLSAGSILGPLATQSDVLAA